MITVNFISKDGSKNTIQGDVGESILEVAQKNKISLEGACEGACACGTCHIIVNEPWSSKLDEKSINEEDALDLAFNVGKNSRLACQIILTENLNGIEIRIA